MPNDVALLTLLLILYLLVFNPVKFEQGNAGWAEPKNSCFWK